MLIAALVITITYTAYRIVSQSYQNFNMRQAEMADLIRLDKLLLVDFDNAEYISRQGEGILLKDSSGIVAYTFQPDRILRQAGITDTFKVRAIELNLSFEHTHSAENPNADPEYNRVDELSFQVLYRKEKIPYHYLKEYSSADLIKRNPYAVH
jgi:hypothetical protein